MIYLDNASTSFHKPDCVARAVVEAMQQAGNSGRGSSGEAMEASRIIFDTRCKIAQLFDVEGPECVAFTANATEALNTALFGTLHPEREKVHAICTEMDHNSVLRPLYALEKRGMDLTILPVDGKGRISVNDLEAAIRPETKAIVCRDASNLTGNCNDIRSIGAIARKQRILFIVDAAQTAGVFPVSMKIDQIDILCFSGHKGLMGPQGTGAICVRPGVLVEPLKVGGSGILTFQKEHPSDMPESLEAGTLNSHGIAGLRASLEWIQETGIHTIRKREQMLMIVLSSSIKAGKNLNTVSASKFPTTRKCSLPLHCLTSFTRNGWKDCPAMLYTNLHAMVNLYMTEKHGISYLPDISLIKSIVCSPKTENGTNCFTLAFLFPTQ